jgi:hypothetical protein
MARWFCRPATIFAFRACVCEREDRRHDLGHEARELAPTETCRPRGASFLLPPDKMERHPVTHPWPIPITALTPAACGAARMRTAGSSWTPSSSRPGSTSSSASPLRAPRRAMSFVRVARERAGCAADANEKLRHADAPARAVDPPWTFASASSREFERWLRRSAGDVAFRKKFVNAGIERAISRSRGRASTSTETRRP